MHIRPLFANPVTYKATGMYVATDIITSHIATYVMTLQIIFITNYNASVKMVYSIENTIIITLFLQLQNVNFVLKLTVIVSLHCETCRVSYMRYHTCVELQMDCTVEPFVMLTAIGILSNNMMVTL